MKELIIVGAGGFGRELLQWIKDINEVNQKWTVKGFIDDNLEALSKYECDMPIIGRIESWIPGINEVFACAIADPNIKEKIVTLLKSKDAKFVQVIHPKAQIGDFTRIGEGVVIYPNSVITVNGTIEDYVTILSSGIGHDAQIGAYSTISSCCDITGGVKIGKRVFIGSHVTVVPQKTIAEDAYVGAGSVVVTNIQKGSIVFGNPATRL